MDDLFTHLKTLAPVAEAIVYITRNGAQVQDLAKRLSQQETDLKTGEERLAEIEGLCAKAKVGAEQARASVIEAQGKIESMISGASAEARNILTKAKQSAQAEINSIRQDFKAEEVKLKASIQTLKETRESLAADTELKRKDHKLVMDSLASLKARLGAA